METAIDIFDLLIAPVAIILIFTFANSYKNRKILANVHYKFYLPALFCKILGSVAMCLIYTFYYTEGGDTTNYYYTSSTLLNILFEGNFSEFFNLLRFYDLNVVDTINIASNHGGFFFNPADVNAMFTVDLILPFLLISFKSFVTASILIACFSFLGMWRLYVVIVRVYPHLYKSVALAIFFIPSVFFWGSGMLKDTFTMGGIGLFIYAIYFYFIIKERKIKYIVQLSLAALIILLIKPYIIIALLPGTIIWINFTRIKQIKNAYLRKLFLPVSLSIVLLFVIIFFNFLGSSLGEYQIDKVLDKAVKTQQDLVRDQYGSNYYNIGEFDASVAGIASKIPAAINMALFRPYLWDASSAIIALSGIENLFILGLSLFILIRVGFITILRLIFSEPLILFALLFSLFFAFWVGLTTANYGALVRLKIPCIPFYLIALFAIYSLRPQKAIRK